MPSLIAFLAVAGLLLVTPGPDMALITRNAVARGRRAALLTALGIEAGLFVWTGASALGLAAMLQGSAVAFAAVKLAGAAYLVYLGLRTLLALRRAGGDGLRVKASAATRRRLPEGSPFQQGLLSNLLNPKIAIFFTSLIPQFVTPGPSAALEATALAAIFVSLGFVWLVAFALFTSTAGQLLRRPSVKRALDGLTGAVLVGFGVRLAADTR